MFDIASCVWSLVKQVFGLCILLFCSVFVWLATSQTALLYHPERGTFNTSKNSEKTVKELLARHRLNYIPIKMPSGALGYFFCPNNVYQSSHVDHQVLDAESAPPKLLRNQTTILFFPGNSGHPIDCIPQIAPFVKLYGFNVLLVCYPGFGPNMTNLKSIPSQKKISKEARQWISDWSIKINESDGKCVLYGYSLGAAVVLNTLSNWKTPNTLEIDSVVVESCPRSVVRAIKNAYPTFGFFPLSLILHFSIADTWDSLMGVATQAYQGPILFLCGGKDTNVPLRDVAKVFETWSRVSPQLRLIEVFDSAPHGGVFLDKDYYPLVNKFVYYGYQDPGYDEDYNPSEYQIERCLRDAFDTQTHYLYKVPRHKQNDHFTNFR